MNNTVSFDKHNQNQRKICLHDDKINFQSQVPDQLIIVPARRRRISRDWVWWRLSLLMIIFSKDQLVLLPTFSTFSLNLNLQPP